MGKAYEESLKATKELNESLKAKTDQEKFNLKVQEHILFKEFDRLVSEINGINLDNDQKTIIKNSLQKKIDSEIQSVNRGERSLVHYRSLLIVRIS